MTSPEQYIVLLDLEKKLDEAIYDAITFFEKKCPYCLNSLYSGHIRSKIHIDHFIPISKGGQNVPWNILPVCQKCNSKKNAKKPRLFLDNEINEKCESYLKKVGEKYIGEVQITLEKFALVKSILTEMNTLPKSKTNDLKTIELLNQIVLDITPKKPEFTTSSSYIINSEIEELITKYFKKPDSHEKLVKLSISEIKNFLDTQKKMKLNRHQLSKKLKELGFVSKIERTSDKIKRCYTLGLNE